jgi:methyl-accepting chemotaxis protein
MGNRNKFSLAEGWKKRLTGRKEPDPDAKQTEPGASSFALGRQVWNPVRSVGTRLFIFFFISIVLFVGTVGLFSYNASKKLIREEVSRFSAIAAQQTADKLGMIFSKYEELSMRFLVESTLQEQVLTMINAQDGSYDRLVAVQTLQDTLTGMSFSNNTVKGIHMFDGNGKLLISSSSITTKFGGGVGDLEWFQKTIALDGKTYWIPAKADGISGQGLPTFGLARVIKNTLTAKLLYVLFIEIDYDVLSDQIAALDLGEKGSGTMINSEGMIVYADDPALLGTQSPFQLTRNSNGILDQDTFPQKDEQGTENLVSYSRASKLNDWYLLTNVPISELTKNAGLILNTTLIVGLVAALAAVLVGLYMMQSIGVPLARLRNLMNEGEKGNLAVRVKPRGKDEIGQLGVSFNRMMEQITQLVKQTSQSAEDVLGTAAELSSVSRNTAQAAKEISVASEQIAEGASTLAIQAENGNEITLEMRDRMKKVVDTNLEMGRSADEVLGVSEQGTEYMKELIAKTDMTEKMTRSMVDKVEKLKESTTSIRKILDVLNAITKQTNILSLNATIEAARAGSAGKGFMVVADEIRKLADQSRESINVVGQITDTITHEIDQTVSVLSEAYPLFQEQMASVKETDVIFGKVRERMADFIRKLDEVTQSIQDLDQSQAVLADAISNVSSVSQESSATSEEVASLTSQQMHASEGLVTLAEKLETLSKQLKESLAQFRYE